MVIAGDAAIFFCCALLTPICWRLHCLVGILPQARNFLAGDDHDADVRQGMPGGVDLSGGCFAEEQVVLVEKGSLDRMFDSGYLKAAEDGGFWAGALAHGWRENREMSRGRAERVNLE